MSDFSPSLETIKKFVEIVDHPKPDADISCIVCGRTPGSEFIEVTEGGKTIYQSPRFWLSCQRGIQQSICICDQCCAANRLNNFTEIEITYLKEQYLTSDKEYKAEQGAGANG